MSNGILDEVRTRKPQLRKALTMVLVAALVAVSIISVFLYVQMKDYHDAKYRSQNVIMGQLSSLVFLTGGYITDMLNTSNSMGERALAGATANEYTIEASRWTLAVREMYLDDSEKNATFAAVDKAVGAVESQMGVINLYLMWNVTRGWPMLESPHVAEKLLAAVPLLTELGLLLDAGFKDDNLDFEKHPYSIVNNLDLAAIRIKALAVYDVLAQ
jgi:hypothetical protein